MRERIRFRLAVLRLFPYGGRMVPLGIALQLVAALMPVAFIVATSAVVGRVPDAVHAGLDSPEWRSLRNTLIAAGLLFVAQQVISPLQFTTQFMLAWRVGDHLRERAAAASFGPVGVAAIEESDIYDTLADLSYAERGTGFSPGSWWAAFVPAAGSLTMRIAIRTGFGMHSRFEGSFSRLRRRKPYFRDLVTGPAAGKEIRVFGLRDWFRAYRTTSLAALLPVWRSRRRRSGVGACRRARDRRDRDLRLAPVLDGADGRPDRRGRRRPDRRARHTRGARRPRGIYAELFALQAAAYAG